ncbi:hypothetical protein [Gordonia rubripertincta]|uniref:DUF222 domain-containing protein n=1 Tax=Gordonia rubripertincta TaxID=36822 RepID=A0ABT4MZ09_GORRU|nr:hypothetical protein [Gordonia rubripertincta]MCZ4552239.1 hypothetical protein [Gordonia rubripertincta]
MNETTLTRDLATRARQLTALARVKRDGLDESQTRGHVQTALNRLDQGLISLGSAINVSRKLKDVGVPVADPINLQQPAVRLQEQAELGRPTSQFLQARFRDVDAARLAIEEANGVAWQSWASYVIQGLPVAMLPRVHFSRRDATKAKIATMRTLGAKTPSIPGIIEFKFLCDRVEEEFSEVGDAGIDSLLERFEDGQIKLSELSDDELAMLRGDVSLTDQLYIHISS